MVIHPFSTPTVLRMAPPGAIHEGEAGRGGTECDTLPEADIQMSFTTFSQTLVREAGVSRKRSEAKCG
jgi:hypothetical protein